ncbi:MAG: glycosyltransferase [Bacteroidota bacterium]|nr:glycosyltransferase [Bacteroidota bacterium]MDX5431742.1 glycosyltransferase [Bacteroidota bacterium]MDX5470457.1 glycosyltransferase [Bacteroidota bacterium]
MSVKLSILLPFVNETDELHQAIQSIIQQTFTDWEMILIHNGREALTPLPEWIQNESRIQLIHEKTPGIAFALNAGLNKARGRYIGRMDADDISLPHRFQEQVAFLDTHPDIGAVSCACRFESDSPALGYKQFVEWQNSVLRSEEHRLSRFQESPLAHPSICFRAELIGLHGPYDTGELPEDYELWLRWMAQGVNLEKIPEIGLIWKDSASRLSRNHPNYSDEAFFRVKAKYLLPLCTGKRILMCGSSEQAQLRQSYLETAGISVWKWTDINPKKNIDHHYLNPSDLLFEEDILVLSLIAQSGTREKVAAFFSEKGYTPGVNFFSCA